MVCPEKTIVERIWELFVEIDDGTGRCGALIETTDIRQLLMSENRGIRQSISLGISQIEEKNSLQRGISVIREDDLIQKSILTPMITTDHSVVDAQRLRLIAATIDQSTPFEIEGLIINYKSFGEPSTEAIGKLFTDYASLSKIGTRSSSYLNIPTFIHPFICLKCVRLQRIDGQNHHIHAYKLMEELEYQKNSVASVN